MVILLWKKTMGSLLMTSLLDPSTRMTRPWFWCQGSGIRVETFWHLRLCVCTLMMSFGYSKYFDFWFLIIFIIQSSNIYIYCFLLFSIPNLVSVFSWCNLCFNCNCNFVCFCISARALTMRPVLNSLQTLQKGRMWNCAHSREGAPPFSL